MIELLFFRITLTYLKFRTNIKNIYITKSIISKFKEVGNDIHFEYPISTIGLSCISIGNNFTARKNIKLRAFKEFQDQKFEPEIVFGNNVSIESDCHIGCINKIIIGNNVLIASNVYISDHMHGLPDYSDIEIAPLKRQLSSKGPVIIGDNVWIGEKVIVLPGVTIGKNSIIGANAVVTKDIPEYSIAVGIPAKVIKTIAH